MAVNVGLYETVRTGVVTLEEMRLQDVVLDFSTSSDPSLSPPANVTDTLEEITDKDDTTSKPWWEKASQWYDRYRSLRGDNSDDDKDDTSSSDDPNSTASDTDGQSSRDEVAEASQIEDTQYLPDYQFVSPSSQAGPGGLLIRDLEMSLTHPDTAAATLGMPIGGTIRGSNIGVTTEDAAIELT